MTLFGYKIPMMASLLVWCVIWEIVGQSGVMFLIPPLSDVLVAAFHLVQTGTWQAAADHHADAASSSAWRSPSWSAWCSAC